MYLNIILTILVVVLITITILLSIWWRKFGKQIFNSTSDIKKVTGGFNMDFGKDIHVLKQMLKDVDKTRRSNKFF